MDFLIRNLVSVLYFSIIYPFGLLDITVTYQNALG